jgi:hypothetical protein
MPVWSGMWIVITGTITGNPERGYVTEYASDLREFSHKSEAVDHGFTLSRSDDFNLGFVRNGRLESLWWMDKRRGEDAEALARIGREIGLNAAASTT